MYAEDLHLLPLVSWKVPKLLKPGKIYSPDSHFQVDISYFFFQDKIIELNWKKLWFSSGIMHCSLTEYAPILFLFLN